MPSHISIQLQLLIVAQVVRKFSTFCLGLNPKFHYQIQKKAVAKVYPKEGSSNSKYHAVFPYDPICYYR